MGRRWILVITRFVRPFTPSPVFGKVLGERQVTQGLLGQGKFCIVQRTSRILVGEQSDNK